MLCIYRSKANFAEYGKQRKKESKSTGINP
mgnify:CR=1 FL=1